MDLECEFRSILDKMMKEQQLEYQYRMDSEYSKSSGGGATLCFPKISYESVLKNDKNSLLVLARELALAKSVSSRGLSPNTRLWLQEAGYHEFRLQEAENHESRLQEADNPDTRHRLQEAESSDSRLEAGSIPESRHRPQETEERNTDTRLRLRVSSVAPAPPPLLQPPPPPAPPPPRSRRFRYVKVTSEAKVEILTKLEASFLANVIEDRRYQKNVVKITGVIIGEEEEKRKAECRNNNKNYEDCYFQQHYQQGRNNDRNILHQQQQGRNDDRNILHQQQQGRKLDSDRNDDKKQDDCCVQQQPGYSDSHSASGGGAGAGVGYGDDDDTSGCNCGDGDTISNSTTFIKQEGKKFMETCPNMLRHVNKRKRSPSNSPTSVLKRRRRRTNNSPPTCVQKEKQRRRVRKTSSLPTFVQNKRMKTENDVTGVTEAVIAATIAYRAATTTGIAETGSRSATTTKAAGTGEAASTIVSTLARTAFTSARTASKSVRTVSTTAKTVSTTAKTARITTGAARALITRGQLEHWLMRARTLAEIEHGAAGCGFSNAPLGE